jgi:hypothetical protein
VTINDDYRLYEIDDEKFGKVIYKTIVLESSDKLKLQKLPPKIESSETLKDLKDFCWDNINKYYHQEAKKALKGEDKTKVI